VLKASPAKALLLAVTIVATGCTAISDYGLWNKPAPIKALRQLINEGDVGAQTALGQRYETGKGVPRDLDRAMKWYIKASDQGDLLAMFLLAQLLEFGFADAPDYKQAAVYYTAAAEMGHAEAQARLAQFYEEGWGVPQNFEMASKWYSLATQQWKYNQRMPLGSTYATGRNTTKNSTYTIQRFQRAAMSGVAEAQFDLAQAYETGNGVPHDTVESEKWYRAAAAQGHSRALDSLKRLLEEGRAQTDSHRKPDQPTEELDPAKLEPSSKKTKPEKLTNDGPIFLAHLSSYRSLELASSDTEQLSGSLTHLLLGISISINRVDLPTTGRVYRVQAGPFSTLSSAKNFCAQVLKIRTYCRVLNIVN
jgi:TPR repeat protein